MSQNTILSNNSSLIFGEENNLSDDTFLSPRERIRAVAEMRTNFKLYKL